MKNKWKKRPRVEVCREGAEIHCSFNVFSWSSVLPNSASSMQREVWEHLQKHCSPNTTPTTHPFPSGMAVNFLSLHTTIARESRERRILQSKNLISSGQLWCSHFVHFKLWIACCQIGCLKSCQNNKPIILQKSVTVFPKFWWQESTRTYFWKNHSMFSHQPYPSKFQMWGICMSIFSL